VVDTFCTETVSPLLKRNRSCCGSRKWTLNWRPERKKWLIPKHLQNQKWLTPLFWNNQKWRGWSSNKRAGLFTCFYALTPKHLDFYCSNFEYFKLLASACVVHDGLVWWHFAKHIWVSWPLSKTASVCRFKEIWKVGSSILLSSYDVESVFLESARKVGSALSESYLRWGLRFIIYGEFINVLSPESISKCETKFRNCFLTYSHNSPTLFAPNFKSASRQFVQLIRSQLNFVDRVFGRSEKQGQKLFVLEIWKLLRCENCFFVSGDS